MKRDWLQIASNVAIVIGLIVVVFELNQSHQHVRAHLVMQDYTNLLSLQSDLMGENPALAIAKSRTSPGELTDAERIVVDAYLNHQYVRVGSASYMEQLGIFESWREMVPLLDYDSTYARGWWATHSEARRAWNAELDRLINEHLSRLEDQP
jgi:hypothetical protein